MELYQIGAVVGGLFGLLSFFLLLLIYLELRSMGSDLQLSRFALERGFGLKKTSPQPPAPQRTAPPAGQTRVLDTTGKKQCPSCGHWNEEDAYQCSYCFEKFE